MSKLASIDGIARRYLHDEVAERMRALIESGEIEPGSRLIELDLCQRFGISRTPLREAIKILATEGILELLPNRGARVATLMAAEVEEMVEVIAALEASAGELACRKAKPDQIAAIETLTMEMEQAYLAKDEDLYFSLNRDIHEAIMAASGNATLMQIYTGLSSRVQRLRYRAHKTDAQWDQAMGDHRAMVAMLKSGDGIGLRDLLREHVRSKAAPILATYA